MIKELIKKHYKTHYFFGGNKYFIDCSNINSDNIIPTDILKNKDEISIFKAIINYSKYLKKNKKIVIKIAHKNRTNLKEFEISEKLKTINGFIKFICLFDCLDDTYNFYKENKKVPNKICTAENIGSNDKYVLISSYIENGSIRNYKWNLSNINILKSLLKQSVISLMEAYIKYGFLHQDLHLDNILFKKTKIENINYDNDIKIKSEGYKIVIMDFDSSTIIKHEDREKGIKFYWDNLYNLFSRITYELNGIRPKNNNYDILSSYITNAISNNINPIKTIDLLDLIDNLEFEEKIPFNLIYDPNIY